MSGATPLILLPNPQKSRQPDEVTRSRRRRIQARTITTELHPPSTPVARARRTSLRTPHHLPPSLPHPPPLPRLLLLLRLLHSPPPPRRCPPLLLLLLLCLLLSPPPFALCAICSATTGRRWRLTSAVALTPPPSPPMHEATPLPSATHPSSRCMPSPTGLPVVLPSPSCPPATCSCVA